MNKAMLLQKKKSFPPYALIFYSMGDTTIGFENTAGITNTALPTQNIYLSEDYYEASVSMRVTGGSLNFIGGITFGVTVESIIPYENLSRESFDIVDDCTFCFLNPYTKECISALFRYQGTTMDTVPTYTVGQDFTITLSWKNSVPQNFIDSLKAMSESLSENDPVSAEGYISTQIPEGYTNTNFLISATNRYDSIIS